MEVQNIVLAFLTGMVMPFITPLLYKAAWKEWVKLIIVFVVATIIGFVQMWATGALPDMAWENALGILTLTYTTSAVVFWGLIDTTGLRPWLEAHGIK